MGKKILVLGGSSFLGINLIDKLLLKGYEVTTVLRVNSLRYNMFYQKYNNKIEIINGDLSEMSWINKLGLIDYIYILSWAGMKKNELDDEAIHEKWKTDLLICSIRLIEKVKPCRIIFAGTKDEYGLPKEKIVDEKVESMPVIAYGKEKYNFYVDMNEYCKKEKIDMVELRIHSIYGPGDKRNKLLYILATKMLNNEDMVLNSDCRQLYNFLYIQDCVEAFISALDSSVISGSYNIGDSVCNPLKKYIEEMKTIIKSESNIVYGEEKSNTSFNAIYCVERFQKYSGWKAIISFKEGISRYIESIDNDIRN